MFKYFINAISSALGFSRTESRGTLILIFIMFMSILGSRMRISYLKSHPTFTPDSTTLDWVKEVQASYELKEQVRQKFDKQGIFSNEKKPMKSTPLTSKSASLFKPKKEVSIIIKDLNTASATDLQSVRGIGPAYSERIVKYRDLLGGYSDTTQLREVYGLNDDLIKELHKSFTIQSKVVPININSDSIRILAKHPYISFDLARVIIAYRKEHGDIKSASDLGKIKAVDQRTLLRLKPYLE